MAENDKEEVIEGEGTKKKLFIIIGVVVVVLGAGGFFGYTMFFGKKAPEEKKEEISEEAKSILKDEEHKEGEEAAKKAEEEKLADITKKDPLTEGKIGNVFALAPFQVNLADAYQDRYIQMTIALEYEPTNKFKEELEQRRAKIRDTIISMTSTKTKKSIMNPEGKMKFRVSIMNTINSFLQRGSIKQLYFTEFIID